MSGFICLFLFQFISIQIFVLLNLEQIENLELLLLYLSREFMKNWFTSRSFEACSGFESLIKFAQHIYGLLSFVFAFA